MPAVVQPEEVNPTQLVGTTIEVVVDREERVDSEELMVVVDRIEEVELLVTTTIYVDDVRYVLVLMPDTVLIA